MNATRLKPYIAGIVIAAALFAGPGIGAEDIPEVDKSEWTVGVAMFGSASVASLFPRLIRDDLSEIVSHRLSSEERRDLARRAVHETETEHLSTLAGLHAKKDALFFDSKISPSEIDAVNAEIDEARRNLRALRSLPLDRIPVPESLDVRFSDPENGGLRSLDGAFPDAFRRREGLDLLITGDIVHVGDYYGIGAYAWTDRGKSVLWEGAGADADIAEIAQRIASSARSLIMGRPWTALAVNVTPEDAVISINGTPVGVGYWTDSTLSPGPVTIEVTAQGHRPRIINEVLIAKDAKDVDVVLEATTGNQVLVRSDPDGAGVRLGALWLGLTPLPVGLPDLVIPLTIEKEGFRPRVVPFSPETRRLTVPLEAVLVDPADELAESRRRLYNAVTWFSFSVAPTMILLGISNNYVRRYRTGSRPEDLRSSYDAYAVSTGLMWGSVALNVGLLTVVLFRLGRYLKAAEELS